jgi:hypothetical protein
LLTWEVQTLLNVTKANVWASMEVARSFLAMARGMSRQARRSWGRKARDSACHEEEEEEEAEGSVAAELR